MNNGDGFPDRDQPGPSHLAPEPVPLEEREKRRSGYDCQFVESPTAAFQTECPICLQVLREPCVISCPCGKKICRKCVESIKEKGKPCPLCNNNDFTFMRDYGLERYLKEFDVLCSHKKDGCEWKGKLAELEEHLNPSSSSTSQSSGCGFVVVECLQGCGEWFLRRHLGDHHTLFCKFRSYSCKYCQVYRSTFHDVTNIHYGECGSYPVSCPENCCEKMFDRRDLEGHLERECPLVVIECSFSFAGCQVRLSRKDQPEHSKQTNIHLSVLGSFTKDLLKQNRELRQRVDENDAESKVHMAGLKHKLKTVQETVEGLRQDVRKLREQKMGLPVDFYVRRSDEYAVLPAFYTHSLGYKMHLEVVPGGEREGAGTHMSLYAYFLNGQYDDQLNWPFKGEIKLKILNQLGEHSHFDTKIVYNEKTPRMYSCMPGGGRKVGGWGFHRLIPHSSLGHNPVKNTQYLKDGYVVIRVVEARCF